MFTLHYKNLNVKDCLISKREICATMKLNETVILITSRWISQILLHLQSSDTPFFLVLASTVQLTVLLTIAPIFVSSVVAKHHCPSFLRHGFFYNKDGVPSRGGGPPTGGTFFFPGLALASACCANRKHSLLPWDYTELRLCIMK